MWSTPTPGKVYSRASKRIQPTVEPQIQEGRRGPGPGSGEGVVPGRLPGGGLESWRREVTAPGETGGPMFYSDISGN